MGAQNGGSVDDTVNATGRERGNVVDGLRNGWDFR